VCAFNLKLCFVLYCIFLESMDKYLRIVKSLKVSPVCCGISFFILSAIKGWPYVRLFPPFYVNSRRVLCFSVILSLTRYIGEYSIADMYEIYVLSFIASETCMTNILTRSTQLPYIVSKDRTVNLVYLMRVDSISNLINSF
jgi:hypothetical protein